jgi:hypothetical protein
VFFEKKGLGINEMLPGQHCYVVLCQVPISHCINCI